MERALGRRYDCCSRALTATGSVIADKASTLHHLHNNEDGQSCEHQCKVARISILSSSQARARSPILPRSAGEENLNVQDPKILYHAIVTVLLRCHQIAYIIPTKLFICAFHIDTAIIRSDRQSQGKLSPSTRDYIEEHCSKYAPKHQARWL